MYKKILIYLAGIILLAAGIYEVYFVINSNTKQSIKKPLNEQNVPINKTDTSPNNTTLANPASVNCINQNGKLEIRKDRTGNEYGVCIFTDQSECEEWTFFRNECTKGQRPSMAEESVDISKDTELIKLALIKKRGFKDNEIIVSLSKDDGFFAAGGVRPVQEGVGGGYIFAARVNSNWEIVADGNGTISCDSLIPYKDFPKDMISECVNQDGSINKR